MGECVFTFDRIELINQKSDTNHRDNDFLSMVWAINDKTYSKTVPLVNTAGSPVLATGDLLHPFQDYVLCQGTDTVIVTYAVINLGSFGDDWGKKTEAAAQFTQGMLKAVAPIYLLAVEVVLGVVASSGTATPEIIEEVASGGGPLVQELSSKIGGLIDGAFNDVLTPLLKSIVGEIAHLLGAPPNCNGEVFHDYVIFAPNQPVNDIHISKTYDGPQANSDCGHAPKTKVDITMHREGIALPQADWRFCGKCQELFYDGYSGKGVCPGGGLSPKLGGNQGHVAAGFNFVLPHDVPGPGQVNWRFCKKCEAMFYDGYPAKGVCPAGGGHEAAGYNFALPHDNGGSGQANWRYCDKCQAMFYDGGSGKGVCPAAGAHILTGTGAGHVAAGYNFVLGHK